MMLPVPGLKTFKIFAPTLIASRDASGRMRIEGVASSTVRDHHGDQITHRALQKMVDSSLGMSIFMNHEYRVPQDVFGIVEKARIDKTGEPDKRTGTEIWDLRFGILVASKNTEAVKLWEMIDAHEVKLGLSIGATIPEGGASVDKSAGGRLIVDDLDLIETSVVGIPANPRAWIDYAMKSITGVFPSSKGFENARGKLETADGSEEIEETEEQEVPGDGVLKDGIEVPADGTLSELAVSGEEEIEQVPIEALSDDFDEAHFDLPAADGAEMLRGLTMDQFLSGDGVPDVLQKAEWSSAYVDDLPTSAFACPKARAYPHHDKNGNVDPAHVRAALSRMGDSGNVQCPGGKAHLEAHARKLGIGQKGLAVDLIKQVDGEHTHPHAHVHSHEHTHGYGDGQIVHSHEHAHVHSHAHDSNHEHVDEFNDYQHNHPHNGSYDDTDHAHSGDMAGSPAVAASAEPEVQKTRVTVWENDDQKVVEVNTGRSRSKTEADDQSAQELAPETAGGQPGAEDDPLRKELSTLVEGSHEQAAGLLKSVIAELKASRAEGARLREERDFAIRLARQAMDGTSNILELVGKMPIGRKTLELPAVKEAFEELSDIYDSGVRKMMQRS